VVAIAKIEENGDEAIAGNGSSPEGKSDDDTTPPAPTA